LLPLYREANTYPHLIEEGIEGSPDKLSAEELRQRAWAFVQPCFLEEREAAAERFMQLANTDKASEKLVEIVSAAYRGRVDALFVALDLQQWGAYDPETDKVQVHQQFEPGDQDLIDFAAVQALLHGANVYAVGVEQMPLGASLAAVFRY
jgi:predicted transcriptional regulator